jgi:glucosamine kinase
VTGSARPEIAGVMRELILSIVAGEIEVIGDVEVAFEDAFGTGPGVLVIAGTGSISYGRNTEAETARAGGWGHAISDEGSGYWIGAEATRAALRARDRGEDSKLLRELMQAIGATDVDDFVVRTNATPTPDFAALVPAVLAAGDRGDGLATKVLEQSGFELARLAEIVIQRLFENCEEISVATHGGVLASSEQVRKSFVGHLRSGNPHVVFTSQTIDPARGALSRAIRGFHHSSGDGVRRVGK